MLATGASLIAWQRWYRCIWFPEYNAGHPILSIFRSAWEFFLWHCITASKEIIWNQPPKCLVCHPCLIKAIPSHVTNMDSGQMLILIKCISKSNDQLVIITISTSSPYPEHFDDQKDHTYIINPENFDSITI